MDVHSQLIRAQVENLSSDPTPGIKGRILMNTTSNKVKYDDGTVIRTLGAGGGGAGGLIWVPDSAGNAPTDVTEFNEKVWQFGSALSQLLYTAIKVPNSYSSGDQLFMRLLFYSPDTSGNLLFQSVATLIRAGTDAFNSTTNQRTSTNAAQTLAAANTVFAATLDITDSTGKINSVSVSAGDIIKVSLTRGTDTGASDGRFIESSVEVTS